MKTIMETEIYSQSTVLRRTYEQNIRLVKKVAHLVKEHNISLISVVARGSSFNACIYFKYLCEIRIGIPVAFIYPSTITLYHGRLNFKNTLLICVSQSGEAHDIGIVLNYATKQGAITVAVTNNIDSPLAQKAQYHLYLNVDREQSMPATKTFTAQILVLGMLVESLDEGNEQYFTQIDKLLRTIDQVLALRPKIEEIADKFTNVNELFVLARGVNLSVSRELCCKLQEICYVNANSYALSDFMHGPFALITSSSHVIIIALDRETQNDAIDMIHNLDQVSAHITLLTDSEELAKLVKDCIILPKTNILFSSFVSIIAGQLLSCILAVKRGINPDLSRNIKKVTFTR